MAVLFLFALSLFNWLFFLPINEAKFAQYFQSICKKMSPEHSDFSALYAATICGINPPPSEIIWNFRLTGLYHLIVVSGAHLIFCSLLIDKIIFLKNKTLKASFKFTLLFFYCLFSGLNPPVVRALAGLLLHGLADRLKLNWNAESGVLMSGLFCLALFPSWWGSLSFLMSWSAAFALTLAKTSLGQCFAVYLVMTFPMANLGFNSPLTIIFNWLLAPVLGFLMLPISFLPFIYKGLTPLSDFAWRILIYIIDKASALSETSGRSYEISYFSLWLILFSLQYFFYRKKVLSQRKQI